MTETDEDGLTLGTSEVAAPYSGRHPRVMTMEADEDGDSRRRRQTHSGDEGSGSSLTADDTPE